MASTLDNQRGWPSAVIESVDVELLEEFKS